MDELFAVSVSAFLERADNGARITIKECEDLLNRIPSFSSKHTIEATKAFLEYLGNPEENIKIIHVAGTNGKGAICSYLEYALSECGLKVGRYASPSVFEFLERIKTGLKK